MHKIFLKSVCVSGTGSNEGRNDCNVSLKDNYIIDDIATTQTNFLMQKCT